MKVSIITVSYNSENTIEETILSVKNQNYKNIEYIIIDGKSKDQTVSIIKKYKKDISKFISEPDKGIYDAMNKGIKLATGDIIGILNSDDLYVDNNVISTIVRQFEINKVDAVFADLVYVNSLNPERIVRYYCSANFSTKKFMYGWMPAHPTFFVKRSCYKKYGLFKTDYKIASDYELLVRFLAKYKVNYSYLPKVIVKMRTGGASTKNFKSNWILNKEIIRACAENNIKTNMVKVLLKYFVKIFQLIKRPKNY